MRQHSYEHALFSAHSTSRMTDSYQDQSRTEVNFQETHKREPCSDRKYVTHTTYTDALPLERNLNSEDDGYNVHLYRAGVLVNVSGQSSVLRSSASVPTTYTSQNNTHFVQKNNNLAYNISRGSQGTHNSLLNLSQIRNVGSNSENIFCCGCKCKKKTSSHVSSTSDNTASFWAVWCRPTILLLMLVLVASVFVLTSGILLYYHYIQNRPSISSPPDPENYWNLQGHEFEPCEKTYCAWGAQCINTPDGKALCQCPEDCNQHKEEAICGTDNVTYQNQCLMRVASCKARLDTRVKYKGHCVQHDLCKDKICGYGARCVVSPDAQNATCVCPSKCHSYGDHVTSHPVCGSDGITYNNKCELDRAACEIKTNITIRFHGKCDPCAGVDCTEPEICQLDNQRNPVCRCGDTCPLEFTPVCGSDGKTYSNECTLRQESCRHRRALNIIYRGKCSSGINPCATAQCTQGQDCSINKFGIAECVCPPECDEIMRPVCSKDGRTFSSDCELKRASCLSRTNIEIAYAGVCGDKGPCNNHQCHFGATCVEKSGSAYCECPTCSSEFEPVCGSDGISYGNECKLRLEACKHRRDIRILYSGPCNGCENKKCEFYSVCESDGVTEGRCICSQNCTEDKLKNELVCGTDGETYISECELQKNSCNKEQFISVAYKGNCDLCANVECKYGARCDAGQCVCPTKCGGSGDEPVCASNMITYSNECEMQMAMCPDSPGYTGPLNVIFYGDCRERYPIVTTLDTLTNGPPMEMATVQTNNLTSDAKEACKDIHCDFEATCELGPDSFPRCTCRFDCPTAVLANPTSNKPVCASDLRIYPSICAMKMEACQRQEELRLRPLELCQGMEVKPCKGEKPVADPVTGRELNCGNGPFRQDCPSGTFCQQTTRFSRCCRKDKNFIEKKNCEDSWFGCCLDGKTPAKGQNFLGCPLPCGCNRLGSYSEYCDVKTNKCTCKPGVGGDKCDRCEPGYWGLPKISSGFKGCLPCGCSMFGSVRDDCEQMTGRCVCKPGVQGQKCTVCTSHNKVLGPNGCLSADLSTTSSATCGEMTCYFGATCVERSGFAICECDNHCAEDNEIQLVCGSDSQTYNSPCELNAVACRLQKDIVIQAFGNCKDDIFTGTDWPIRRYTPLQFTQPDEGNSPLSKSTRHLLAPDSNFYYGSTTKPLSSDGKDINARKTSATARVMALLGDICSKTSECTIINSYCVSGACTCLPAYYPSNDRQTCLENSRPTKEYQACSSSPCFHLSTCIDLPGATFNCVCSENYTGSYCEYEITLKEYEIPAFSGRSYAILKTIEAYNKLIIEIELKSYTYEGILLYNAENENGTGDYISLSLINGFVEFKYNLGHGPVVMRSLDKIELGKFHKIVVKRYNRDGLLKLDDADDVAAQATGSTKALDLQTDTFIGYVPTHNNQIFENIGTDKGFEGCIKKLKIGRDEIELHALRHNMVLETNGIYDCRQHACEHSPCANLAKCIPVYDMFRCECTQKYSGKFCDKLNDPCMSNPCVLGAICRAFDQDRYTCQCPPGHNDKKCKIGDHLPVKFTGNTHLQYQLKRFRSYNLSDIEQQETVDLRRRKKKEAGVSDYYAGSELRKPELGNDYKFEIRIFVPDGLLLWKSKTKRILPEYFAIAFENGVPQVSFNLGREKRFFSIRGNKRIDDGHWHTVHVRRKKRIGMIQIDGERITRDRSSPGSIYLRTTAKLWIGGTSTLPPGLPEAYYKGLYGCIKYFLVHDKPFDLLSNVEDKKVNFCHMNDVTEKYVFK